VMGTVNGSVAGGRMRYGAYMNAGHWSRLVL
jgi:hypothetical protein